MIADGISLKTNGRLNYNNHAQFTLTGTVSCNIQKHSEKDIFVSFENTNVIKI
jgi:hypothetical protein